MNTAFGIIIGWWIFVATLIISVWGLIGYVAYHFISMYW